MKQNIKTILEALRGSKPTSDDKDKKDKSKKDKDALANKGNTDAVKKDEPQDKLSGKKEKIIINPNINEGVASVRNKILQSVGASSRMSKQWMKVGNGKIRVEIFDDGPNSLYVRFTGENLEASEAEAKFKEIRSAIRVYAAKQKVPLIKAAPKVPESMKGVEHIVLGSYNRAAQRMTLEVTKPKK